MSAPAEQSAPTVNWQPFDGELDQLAEALARLLMACYRQHVAASARSPDPPPPKTRDTRRTGRASRRP